MLCTPMRSLADRRSARFRQFRFDRRNIASEPRSRRSSRRRKGSLTVSHGRAAGDGSDAANAEPCTGWVNETLCKLLYMRIRTTVSYQELTGCSIDYTVPSRCFPELRDDLLAA